MGGELSAAAAAAAAVRCSHTLAHAATSNRNAAASPPPAKKNNTQPPTTHTQVLGVERSPTIGHGTASHHGQTRITRLAYLEGAQYVPLLRRSFELYAELEREAGEVCSFVCCRCYPPA